MDATVPIPMLDLMFFLTESIDNPRHVGAVLVFRKPKHAGATVVAEIVEAYRNARPHAPFNRVPVFRLAGLPVWREVDDVDANVHVRRLQLPSPGTEQQLHELIADLHAPMLERNRPGWRLYVIDGLAGDRFAIYHKCHHALVDGESGIEILRRSLAESSDDRRIRTTIGFETAARSPRGPVGLRSMLEREASRLTRRTLSIGVGSAYLVEQVLGGLRGYDPARARAFTAPHTLMNEPIRKARSISHATLSLARMKAVARRTGTTLNDVALCVLDAAVHRYLRSEGHGAERPLIALCPVSLRGDEAKDATTNVSAIWPPLGPVRARIDRRLQAIADHTRAAKADLRRLGKGPAYAYAVMAFALSETLAITRPESHDWLPANLLVSNVRGPERPLYLNGARLEALFPVSTLIVGVGLNVTFMSYAGQVVLGFTANGAALPEVESLARGVVDAFAALERAVAPASRARKPKRASPEALRRVPRRTDASPRSP